MRRLGLLTAVFALAVGIVVAFEASPDAAQPQPRAHVYLLRGLLTIFSLGMDTLAEELKGHDVYTTVHSYSDWQTLADGAAADYKAGKEAPIILIGHSLGADAVMEMAAYLGRKGVPVALVVPFDCTKSFAASDNVARVLNLTHGGTLTYMRGGPGFRGTLANVDVSSDASIDHINIDKSPQLHARVVAEVLAVVGNHKRPAKKGNGADAGTARPVALPEQGGSRQKADNPAPPPHKPPPGTQPLQIPN
jgi:Thioesterase domain